MQVVKSASITHPARPTENLSLQKVERGVFRWTVTETGQPWDGKDWLSEQDAIQQIRVTVDCEPEYVGCDLTVREVDPTPDERAAKRVFAICGMDDHEYSPLEDSSCRDSIQELQDISQIIRDETNINGILDATETLLAYLFIHRAAFSVALFLTTKYGFLLQQIKEPIPGRDLTMDGLILACVEAVEKAKQQDYSNLKKPLTEPISEIAVATRMPKPPKGIVQ